MPLVVRLATLMLPALLMACQPAAVVPPVPPGAVPVALPADISSERLSLVVDEVNEALKPGFGPLESTAYRLPADTRWDDLERFYTKALDGRLEPLAGVYRQGRRHRLAVWSAGGRTTAPMVAVAFVDTPVGGEPPANTVLVVLVPAAR